MAGTTGRYQAAFGAERSPHVLPDEWPWVDLSERTQESEAVITRGRMANQQQVTPATLAMLLDNGDGALTPRHPGSPYYPHVVKGTPIRYSVRIGDPYLQTNGSGIGASTPDHASLDIVGDIALAVELVAPVRGRIRGNPLATDTPSSNMLLKWVPTSDERSYRLYIATGGLLGMTWSTDGTDAGSTSATSAVRVPELAAGPQSFAVELDVDNGLGGYTLRYYAWRGELDDLLANLADALFDERVTTSGVTSVYASTVALAVGGNLSDSVGRYAGQISQARVITGSLAAGTEVANPDFRAATVGAASFPDATGKIWTVGASSEITDYRHRFCGELTGSYPTWPGAGAEGTAQVRWDAAGVLRRMRQNAKPLDSPMRRSLASERNADFVHAYWPMDDGREASSAQSPVAGVQPLVYGGDMNLGSDGTCPGSDPVVNVAEGKGFGWVGRVPAPSSSHTLWRCDFFAKFSDMATAPAQTLLMVVDTTGSIASWTVGVNSTSTFVVARDRFGGTVDSSSVGVVVDDVLGNWTYWSLELEQNGGSVDITLFWIPLEGPGQGGAFSLTDSFTGTIGRMSGVRNLGTAPDGGISFGNIVVATDVNFGWLANADTAWVTESATQRISRLCAEQNVPLVMDGPTGSLTAGLDEGVASMGPQRSLPFLALLEECAAADFGYLSEDYSTDSLVYRTGATLVNQPAALTITDELTREIAPADDYQGLINQMTVEQTEGSRVTVRDEVSIAEADVYDGKITVNVADVADLVPQAGLRLTLATWPEMRYGTIPMELSKTPALWEDWIRTRPGDLLRATTLPSTHPTNELRQLLDGYVETISTSRWRVVANTTPEGPWNAGVLDQDSGTPDTDMHAIDTDGSELNGAIDADDLTMDVAVTAGELWTTAAGDFPLDVEVGGEVVTVSGISGASSPQTFTISARSVNGITKAHSAGALVRVAHPLYATI